MGKGTLFKYNNAWTSLNGCFDVVNYAFTIEVTVDDLYRLYSR